MTPEGSLRVTYLDGLEEDFAYAEMGAKGWWMSGDLMGGDICISMMEPVGRVIIPRAVIRKLRVVYNSPQYSEWCERQRIVESMGLDGSVAFPEHSTSGRGHDFRDELRKQGYTPDGSKH